MSGHPTPPPMFGPAYGVPRGLGPEAYRRSSSRKAWMITFTDLVALMLTFFVLLFAMSQIQQQKWEALVQSLASDLNATYKTEAVNVAADEQAAAEIAPPGADLDYIEPILREHFAAEPMLAGAALERADGGLSVTFPDERLFVDGTPELTERGAKVVFALGSVLRNLDNAVDVNARIRSAATADPSDWQTALARSVAIVRVLAQSGFAGPIVARAQGSGAAPGGRKRHADGVDILVREDRRG